MSGTLLNATCIKTKNFLLTTILGHSTNTIPFYPQGNWSSEMLDNKVTQAIPKQLGPRGPPSPISRQAWREWPPSQLAEPFSPGIGWCPCRFLGGNLPQLTFRVYWFPVAAVTNCHKFSAFKTTEIYSHTVLEVRGPRSRCWQGFSPSCGSRGESFLASSRFWWLHYSNLFIYLLAFQLLPPPSPHNLLCVSNFSASLL